LYVGPLGARRAGGGHESLVECAVMMNDLEDENRRLRRVVQRLSSASDNHQVFLEDAQTCNVELEHELMQQDAELRQKQSLLDDMHVRCDELCGILDSERDVADELRMKVQCIEDELEYLRRQPPLPATDFMVLSPKNEKDENLAKALQKAGADPSMFGPHQQRRLELLRRQLLESGNGIISGDFREDWREHRQHLGSKRSSILSLSKPEEELAPPLSAKADPDHRRYVELSGQLAGEELLLPPLPLPCLLLYPFSPCTFSGTCGMPHHLT